MRHFGRTHGVSVATLHETTNRDDVDLSYERTYKQNADIYTKGFTDKFKCQDA